MQPHHMLAAMAVASLLSQSVGLSLPSLFGFTRDADAKGAEDADDADEQALDSPEKEVKEPPHEPHEPYEPHYPTKKPTRPPLLVVPHPADHPLHPHNNPDHPLHPDNLPTLPPIPPLPALPDLHNRETIYATKTVYAVATEKVTIHPICMKVTKHAPPCLPYDPHPPPIHHQIHQQIHHHLGWKDEEGDKGEGGEAINPSKAVDSLQTSAVAELDQPILLVDGETESGPAQELTGAEGERDGRYVELTPALGATPEKVEIKDEPAEVAGGGGGGGGGGFSSPLTIVQNLINHHRPVTLYKTKTVWLTKVDKVLDTRVTATLVPNNCVPVNSHIPACGPPGAYGTGFQFFGQQHGVYTETLSGHYLPGALGKDEQTAAPDDEEAKELPDDEQASDSK